MNAVKQKISKIGILPSDSSGLKLQKNFLSYLTIWISIGALSWGVVTLYFGLMLQASVAFGFVGINLLNMLGFGVHKNFKVARSVQIFTGLIFPFVFQALLGGFMSSGVFMIWATLALIISLTFREIIESILWLILFLGLTVLSAFLDSYFYTFAPESLSEFSVVFTLVNISAISCVIFGMMLLFVKRQMQIHNEVSENFELLKKKEEEIRLTAKLQSDDAEKLQHAQAILEGQNKKLEESEAELKRITIKQLEINERLLGSQDDLKLEEKKFRSVVENAPIIIQTIDKKGVFKLSEGGILHTIGLRPGQLVGTNALTMYRDNPIIFKAFRSALNGESKSLITRINDRVFDSHFIPIRDESVEVTGVLNISSDITIQQQSEEQLEKALLRAKNSEESLKLIAEDQIEASERLIEAEEMLQRALADEKSSKMRLTEGLGYARTVQQYLIPSDKELSTFFGHAFSVYRPKDHVSGDFYWFHEINDDQAVLSMVDCMGHGVSAALLTMVGDSLLSQIVKDKAIYTPGKILSELDNGLKRTFNHAETGAHESMDVSVIWIDKKANKLEFAGAKSDIVYIESGAETRLRGSKKSIGSTWNEDVEFENHVIDLKSVSGFYLFSDGYLDQVNGATGKKVGIRKFIELISSSSSQEVSKQRVIFDAYMDDWQQEADQIDDITLVGIQF